MTSFVDRMKKHMSDYRERRLGVTELGTFNYRGEDLEKEHILPRDLSILNIHETYRLEVQQHLRENPQLKLHRYFHHLNSSQAFAFNLFFPFFHEGAERSFLTAAGLPGDVKKWCLEHVPFEQEGTNVDAAWQGSDGAWTFCEVKLTENEFGPTADDDRHQEKYRDIYQAVLEPIWTAGPLDRSHVFRNYQIFRNLWLGAKESDSTVVFLLPRENAKPWSQVHEILDGVDPTFRKRVHVVAVEDLLDKLARASDLPPRLATTVQLLREKYLLPSADAG